MPVSSVPPTATGIRQLQPFSRSARLSTVSRAHVPLPATTLIALSPPNAPGLAQRTTRIYSSPFVRSNTHESKPISSCRLYQLIFGEQAVLVTSQNTSSSAMGLLGP